VDVTFSIVILDIYMYYFQYDYNRDKM